MCPESEQPAKRWLNWIVGHAYRLLPAANGYAPVKAGIEVEYTR